MGLELVQMALGHLTPPLCLLGRDRAAGDGLFTDLSDGCLRHMASAQTRG